MLSQMDYDNLRWGDTWLMQSVESQEKTIQDHFNHYFEYYRLYGKKVPWLKSPLRHPRSSPGRPSRMAVVSPPLRKSTQ